jgi:hypothetical protein
MFDTVCTGTVGTVLECILKEQFFEVSKPRKKDITFNDTSIRYLLILLKYKKREFKVHKFKLFLIFKKGNLLFVLFITSIQRYPQIQANEIAKKN